MKVVVWFRDRLWSFFYRIDRYPTSGQEILNKKSLWTHGMMTGDKVLRKQRLLLDCYNPGI
jgi:hypothetical protein